LWLDEGGAEEGQRAKRESILEKSLYKDQSVSLWLLKMEACLPWCQRTSAVVCVGCRVVDLWSVCAARWLRKVPATI
jgi:hypothetical protein